MDERRTDSVEASRQAARRLELVCALAMALPAREPGPLRYPEFRELGRQRRS